VVSEHGLAYHFNRSSVKLKNGANTYETADTGRPTSAKTARGRTGS